MPTQHPPATLSPNPDPWWPLITLHHSNFVILRIIQCVSFEIGFISLSKLPLRSIQFVGCINSFTFCYWLVIFSMDVPWVCLSVRCWRMSGLFLVSLFWIKIYEHLCTQFYVNIRICFFGINTQESYVFVTLVFNFVRNCQLFQSGCANLHSHQQCMNALAVSCLF